MPIIDSSFPCLLFLCSCVLLLLLIVAVAHVLVLIFSMAAFFFKVRACVRACVCVCVCVWGGDKRLPPSPSSLPFLTRWLACLLSRCRAPRWAGAPFSAPALPLQTTSTAETTRHSPKSRALAAPCFARFLCCTRTRTQIQTQTNAHTQTNTDTHTLSLALLLLHRVAVLATVMAYMHQNKIAPEE